MMRLLLVVFGFSTCLLFDVQVGASSSEEIISVGHMPHDNDNITKCEQWTVIEKRLQNLERKVEKAISDNTAASVTPLFGHEHFGTYDADWVVWNETLHDYLRRENESAEAISRIWITFGNNETHHFNLSDTASPCERLGFSSSERLSNLDQVHFWISDHPLNLLRCLMLFAPRLKSLNLNFKVKPEVANKTDEMLKSQGTFPSIESVSLSVNDMEGEVEHRAIQLLSLLPSLKSIQLHCFSWDMHDAPKLAQLHRILQAPSTSKDISEFIFEGSAALQNHSSANYPEFCNSRAVRLLHFQWAGFAEDVERLVANCSEHLEHLGVNMRNDAGFYEKDTTVVDLDLPRMERLKSLHLSLNEGMGSFIVKFGLAESKVETLSAFPALVNLTLDIAYHCGGIEWTCTNSSAILENEAFLAQLQNVQMVTIKPKGLLKTDPNYMAIMKKFAIWFPNLREISVGLLRLGVKDMNMLGDEFAP